MGVVTSKGDAMTYERMEDGAIRVAVPEPFWVRGWRTLFFWRPACYKCQIIYTTREQYTDHYVFVHAYEETR